MSIRPQLTIEPYNGVFGTMPREAFNAAYESVPLKQYRKADVLMEFLEGDTTQVMLYPANAGVAVYAWRTFWRKRELPEDRR